MTDALAHQSFQVQPAPATVANVMRPPLTTVEQAAHVAAAAYLMKHAGATALMVLDAQTHTSPGRLRRRHVVEQRSRSSRLVLKTAATRGLALRRRHCSGNVSTTQQKAHKTNAAATARTPNPGLR
jgi:CBS-domain-containing membrane protein